MLIKLVEKTIMLVSFFFGNQKFKIQIDALILKFLKRNPLYKSNQTTAYG